MLIISEHYANIDTLIHTNKLYETKDSDSFEKKCARYLRKQYPNHKFDLKGGSNRMFSDILVDDSFYIECKMTENNNKKVGAQSTGFGIKLNIDKHLFECSDTAENNEAAHEMLDYVNANFDTFSKLVNQHTSKIPFDMDQSVFASWISNYYKSKNVKYFISMYSGSYIIFENTPKNLLKYFDIVAFARYYANGTKNVPLSIRDSVLDYINKCLNVKSVRFDGLKTIITLKGIPDDKYIQVPDSIKVFLSDKGQKENEYRLMKVSSVGTPRILFGLSSKLEQDKKDLDKFEKFLNAWNLFYTVISIISFNNNIF